MYPLIARIVKWITETMHKDIENIVQHDSQKYITSEGEEDLSNQKWNNCEIEYDQFCWLDCNKSLCLDNTNKMSAFEKLYNIVKILNMNDDNEKKFMVFQLISSENLHIRLL